MMQLDEICYFPVPVNGYQRNLAMAARRARKWLFATYVRRAAAHADLGSDPGVT